MKRIFFLLLIIFAAVFLFCEEAANAELFPFLPVEGVKAINNRDYVPELVKVIDSSKFFIHAVIYQVGHYPDYPDGVNTDLENAMIRAAGRGVDVDMVVDQSSWNPSMSVKNEEYAEYMRGFGVKVHFDPPDMNTHTKVVVIDSLYTVVGSTNWSFYALAKNNECAVLIKSREVAASYEKDFKRLLMFVSDTLTIKP